MIAGITPTMLASGTCSGDGHGHPPQDWGFDQTFGVYSGGSAH
ncbi:hypothetical protein JCM19236_387 [Vibrio sp. JCM 19236]|nr:hypothetical protein JCM19236_387 [Vibrio sp. JCM 19236]